MKQFEFYTELVKQNISYDMLRHDCKTGEEQLLDEIVAIVAEFLSVPRETALIGGVKYPYQYVRNRFLLLDDAHIRYVLECFRKNTTEVRNIKAYLLSSMLNATNTIDLYYQAKAQHDLHADGTTLCREVRKERLCIRNRTRRQRKQEASISGQEEIPGG